MLELQQHQSATFTTLTYETAPPTLSRTDLSLFLKRLRRRTARLIRFFASGEYGEQTQRPHYHAILYNTSLADAEDVENAWGLGLAKVLPATPATIAYTAGYCAKKIGFRQEPEERIDYETGEVYNYQPPFIQMSRRPGLAAAAARRFATSWEHFAVLGNTKVPVPRYLKNVWADQATEEQMEQHAFTLDQLYSTRHKYTREELDALDQINQSKKKIKAARRHL